MCKTYLYMYSATSFCALNMQRYIQYVLTANNAHLLISIFLSIHICILCVCICVREQASRARAFTSASSTQAAACLLPALRERTSFRSLNACVQCEQFIKFIRASLSIHISLSNLCVQSATIKPATYIYIYNDITHHIHEKLYMHKLYPNFK